MSSWEISNVNFVLQSLAIPSYAIELEMNDERQIYLLINLDLLPYHTDDAYTIKNELLTSKNTRIYGDKYKNQIGFNCGKSDVEDFKQDFTIFIDYWKEKNFEVNLKEAPPTPSIFRSTSPMSTLI
jgi:hypothetical protein